MIIDLQKYCEEKELFFETELASKIIHSMQTDGEVTLRSKETRSYSANGLYKLLDELCSYWNWAPSKITIETNNELEQHDRYNIVHVYFHHMVSRYSRSLLENITPVEWNQEKLYGMFIGRANTTRIRGIHNHLKFQYRNQGLTSFNHNMKNHVDQSVLLEYLTETSQPFNEMISVNPYSDIGEIMTPPITEPRNIIGWEKVYEKIGIELVFETAEVPSSHWTEKILRPILYKRPFMVVAWSGFIAYHSNRPKTKLVPYKEFDTPELRELLDYYINHRKNYKFFGHYINLDYDKDSGIHRVDHVFDILNELIRTKKIYNIIEACRDDIEHNYNVLQEEIKMVESFSTPQRRALQYHTWIKR